MRTLVISPLFPPLSDAEANCGGKFVQALINSGVEPTVIFSSDVRAPRRLDRSLIWEPVRRVSVDARNPLADPGTLDRFLLSVKYQSTCWVRWTQAVVSKAKELHRQTPFDLIISRSLPLHAHIAGYWVSSRLRLPWVAVMNDPWDFSPFIPPGPVRRYWTPNFNWKMWRHRVVARADRLCFPCKRLRDSCLQGSVRKSGVLITPHIGAVSETARRADEFLIVHAGNLGMNELTGRSAVALLDGLQGLFRIRPAARSQTRLVFVGPKDPETLKHVARRGLSEQVACTGLLNYEDSLHHIGQAAVCVLVEADIPEGVFLPSKLADYITARKPVLALSPKVGTVADLAVESGIRRVGPKDTAAVTAALVELFDAFVESRLDRERPSESLVERFEGKRVIEDFLGSIASLVPKAALRPYPSRSCGKADILNVQHQGVEY
jgi:glycosyltransferase involved in cell wall biosynthesis